MHEFINKVLNGLWGIWRFRWIALITAWLIASIGWFIIHKLEHKYYSTARIYVDTNQVLEPLLSGLAIQPDVKTRVKLMSETLLSRPNLELVVNKTELGANSQNIEADENILDGLSRNLSIYDTSSRSIYNIGYEHQDPVIAKNVVQTLIDIFIDSNLGEEREDNAAAQEFLDARIAEYEIQLEAAEKRLSDFKRVNAGSMPGESGDYYQRIETAQSQLRTASLLLREAQNRRDELRRQLDREQPIVISSDPSWVPPDLARIQGLQEQLDVLLARYTERHPRVSQLRETIKDLEQTRIEKLTTQALNPDAGRRGPIRSDPSPVHQQVRTMVAESEARVAELQVRVSQYQLELNDLRATVDSIPQVEAQLAQLDRDYETISSQHAILLERRESARLTEAVKVNSDDVKFKVVDPPYVPSRPSVPNKKILNLTVLGFSTALGVGLSFLLGLLIPVFYDKQSLERACGKQVLGNVSLYESTAKKFLGWIGVGIFLTLAALLIGTAALLLMFEYRNIDPGEWLMAKNIPIISNILQSDAYQKLANLALFQKITAFLEQAL